MTEKEKSKVNIYHSLIATETAAHGVGAEYHPPTAITRGMSPM